MNFCPDLPRKNKLPQTSGVKVHKVRNFATSLCHELLWMTFFIRNGRLAATVSLVYGNHSHAGLTGCLCFLSSLPPQKTQLFLWEFEYSNSIVLAVYAKAAQQLVFWHPSFLRLGMVWDFDIGYLRSQYNCAKSGPSARSLFATMSRIWEWYSQTELFLTQLRKRCLEKKLQRSCRGPAYSNVREEGMRFPVM